MSKREQLASLLSRSGVTSLLERVRRPAGLIVFNYHRIGSAESDRFDSGLFSATAESLDIQIRYLKKRYRLLTLDEAIEWVRRKQTTKETPVLITFDDGYKDNYDYAFPVLKAHRVPASFFLTTSFVGSSAIPWWDRIAYIVRGAGRRVLRFNTANGLEIPVGGPNQEVEVRTVLQHYRSDVVSDRESFIKELESQCNVPLPEAKHRRFMDWNEAREMLAAGMSIGSHTHTHPILSAIPSSEQHEELVRSRDIIESELGIDCRALAYPVGGRNCFTAETVLQARRAGYWCAFSYYGGANRPSTMDAFDLRRLPVELDQSFARFRLRVTLGGTAAESWI